MSEARPSRAIVVVPFDPNWIDTFERVRERVWPVLRDVALTVEHVGSTAVPGLWAKPIVNVDVIVPDETHPHDIDAYVSGKTELVLRLLREAGFAPAELAAIEQVNRAPS